MTAPAPTTFAAVLRAELTRRCARNPSYSLRAFACALEVDHATLSQILRGRRAFGVLVPRRGTSSLLASR